MGAGSLHVIDVLIVFSFVAYAIASGLSAKDEASKNMEEYFLAGRSLSGWKAGISMAATQFAADTPLLVTGLIATAGIFALWQMWIYALAFLLMGFVLAPSWRRASVLTDAELTELRYGDKAATALRTVKAIYFGTIFNCVVLAWVLYATRVIAEPFLTWNRWLPAGLFGAVQSLVEAVGVQVTLLPAADPQAWVMTTNNMISIGALVTVTAFYSTTGGLRSVVNTDVFQFGVAMVGTVAYAGYVVYEAGGMGAIVTNLRETYAHGGPGGITAEQVLAFTPSRAKDVSAPLLLAFALQWLIQLNADGTGYLAQRSMACRSDRDARLASLVFTVAQVLLRSLIWLPIALGLLVLFPPDLSLDLAHQKAVREATFVRGIAETLPPGLRGLMLTAMLAALASTIDTHLNWGSSYWTNDIYKRLICQAWLRREPDPRALVWVARCSNLGILALGMLVMTQLTSIDRAWRTALLLGAGMGVMLVLRWLWWRVTAWGELATIAVSLVAALPVILALDAWEGVSQPTKDATGLLVMALLATTAGVGVSLLTREDPARLRAFFRLAQPPGWWGQVASECGVSPAANVNRLGRSVLAMFGAALSVFSLLVGTGSLLVGSPEPSWWPLPWALWILAQFAVGLGLIPWWWRLGFAEEAQAAPLPILETHTIDPVSDVARITDIGRISGEGPLEASSGEPEPPAPPA